MRIKRLLAMAVVAIMFSSCSYTTTHIGTITTYNIDGSVLKKWDKVCIHEEVNKHPIGNAFKSYGVNFYDIESGRFIVIGNAVPYIVEYDILTRNSNDTDNDLFKMELIDRHDHLCYMLKEYEVNLKYSKKDSEEHKKWKETIDRTKIEINNIVYTLSREYSYYME